MTNAQPHTCSLKTNHVFFPINDLSHFFFGLIFFFFFTLGFISFINIIINIIIVIVSVGV